MLNVDRLRTLCALADHGSIAATARSLHLSESAVSQQLSRLQSEVGHELLTKVGRRLVFTPAGERLVVDGRTLLDELRSIEDRLDAAQVEPAGSVTVAAFATAVRTLVLAAMAELGDRAPALSIRIVESEPHHAMAALRRGDVDVAIINHWDDPPDPDPRLETISLLVDPVVVAVVPSHRLAGRRSVRLADLDGERLVSWPKGMVCRQWLVSALTRADVDVDIVHDAAEHETQLALVAAGHGIAVLPRLGAVDPAVRFLPVAGDDRRRIDAVIRRGATRDLSTMAVVDALGRSAGAVVV